MVQTFKSNIVVPVKLPQSEILSTSRNGASALCFDREQAQEVPSIQTFIS